MSNAGDYRPIPATSRPPGAGNGDSPAGSSDPFLPLLNLSTVRSRMDSLQQFLSVSISTNTLIGQQQMQIVSSEIASAVHQIIVNGAALLAAVHNHEIDQNCTVTSSPIPVRESMFPMKTTNYVDPIPARESIDNSNFGDEIVKNPMKTTNSMSIGLEEGAVDLKTEATDEDENGEWEIIELDAVELLAEHVHFCEICGKGFKRDANLRMHMRAHGNQFKTPESLAKPEKCGAPARRRTRFSCPFVGCNRNKQHKKFRPLKSVICVKNHFKRSHCPKMFSCNRCNKKSFSVVADLKSHLKHCGESKWKCSCGTSFSRKDKLFGHMALFEGHMPAVLEEEEKGKGPEVVMVVDDDDEEEDGVVKEMELNCSDNMVFDEMLEGFGSIENCCLQEILDSVNGVGTGTSDFPSL